MPPDLRADVAAQLGAIRVWFSFKTPNLLRSLEPQLNLIRDRVRSWHDNRLYRQRQAQLNLVRRVSMVHPEDVEKLEQFAAGLLKDRGISIPKLPVGRPRKQPVPPELKRPRGRPRKDSYTTTITETGLTVVEMNPTPEELADEFDNSSPAALDEAALKTAFVAPPKAKKP
jgi:hypothetical protein